MQTEKKNLNSYGQSIQCNQCLFGIKLPKNLELEDNLLKVPNSHSCIDVKEVDPIELKSRMVVSRG